jgi:hypothetical protein
VPAFFEPGRSILAIGCFNSTIGIRRLLYSVFSILLFASRWKNHTDEVDGLIALLNDKR